MSKFYDIYNADVTVDLVITIVNELRLSDPNGHFEHRVSDDPRLYLILANSGIAISDAGERITHRAVFGKWYYHNQHRLGVTRRYPQTGQNRGSWYVYGPEIVQTHVHTFGSWSAPATA